MHLGRSHLQRHRCASQTGWLAPEPRARGGSQHHLLFLFLLQAPGAAQPCCHTCHSAIQPQGIAGEEGALHFAVEQFLRAKEPGKHSIPYLHILSISQPSPHPAQPQTSASRVEPDVCLFTLPEARVCGAEQQLIRLLGIWELLFTEPPEKKEPSKRGREGRGGERNPCSDV